MSEPFLNPPEGETVLRDPRHQLPFGELVDALARPSTYSSAMEALANIMSLRDLAKMGQAVSGVGFAIAPFLAKNQAAMEKYRSLRNVTVPQSLPGSEYIQKFFRGPLMHGVQYPNSLRVDTPFDEAHRHGLRLGEPEGVSTTIHPYVARGFGSGVVLQVVPKFGPSEALPVFNEEKSRPVLLEAYRQALQEPAYQNYGGATSMRHDLNRHLNNEALTLGSRSYFNKDETPSELMTLAMQRWVQDLGRDSRERFNHALADSLVGQGYKALVYSPNRYGEHEMRVLNPDRDLEILRRVPKEAMSRYVQAFDSNLPPRPYTIPGPASLSDVYRTFTPEELGLDLRPPGRASYLPGAGRAWDWLSQ